MKQERPLEIKIQKETENTTTPTDETLFEGFYSLEHPTLEGLEKLEKELSEYPELKPRLTFPFPLDKERIEAIEMLRTGKIDQERVVKLIESQDFIERDAGIYFLDKIKGLSNESINRLQSILGDKEWKEKNRELAEKIKVKIILETEGEKALETLTKMSQAQVLVDLAAQMAAIEGLGEIGNEKSLPVLEKLCKKEKGSPVLVKTADKARVKIILKTQPEEKALPILRKMYLEPGPVEIELAATEGLGSLSNKKAIKTLREKGWIVDLDLPKTVLEETGAQAVRNIIMQIAEKGGEKARADLREMCRDENEYVSRPAAKSLARLIIKTEGKKADEVLIETFKDYDEGVKEAVEFEKNKHEWLLGTQKPLFATAHLKELAKNLLELEKTSSKLKEEFGDKFIGLIVFGSAFKGYYFEKKREIDLVIIAKEDAARKIRDYYDDIKSIGRSDFRPPILIDEKRQCYL